MPALAELFDEATRHHQSGWLGLAEDLYRRILQTDPRHAHAWHLLGLIAADAGRPDQAVEYIGNALRLIPDLAEGHFNLGNVLSNQDKLVEAEACYRQAVRLKPSYAEAHGNLGNVLRNQGKLEEAEACCREGLRLKPDIAEAHNNLGVILQEQGRLEEAEICCREALRLKPSYAKAHYNLGNVFRDLGKLEKAKASLIEALRLQPFDAEAHYSLAGILQQEGHLEEAEDCCREAVRLRPDSAEAHTNLGFCCLLQGKYAKGWPEYEWRHFTKDNRDHALPPPTWDGSALNGQSILLQAEQGVGDTFQFVRYARLVKEKGGRVLLRCPAALAGILSGCPGIDQLVPEGTPLPEYTAAAPLLSLPSLFGTTLDTIPADVPYVKVAPERVALWRARLAALPGLKVGVCWQGNPRFKFDRQRSVPLACFAALAEVPGVILIALQRGAGLEQIDQQSEHLRIIDLSGRSEDPAEGWLDTAALIAALDLVISIDSAVAHLAGALGAPVWLALPFMRDWRWLLKREDSPWYPSMRLFRQRKAGDWADVFQRIAEELRQWVAVRQTTPREN